MNMLKSAKKAKRGEKAGFVSVKRESGSSVPKTNVKYDIGAFALQSVSNAVGEPFAELIDPKSFDLWRSYMAEGWKPVSMVFAQKDRKVLILFERSA